VTPQSPGEVLAAVRRLEADLEVMRARARDRERDVIDLQATMAAHAAREREALVEDMERIVELIGASWRSTHDQVTALAVEVAGLRRFAEESLGSLGDARLELRLGAPAGNGGH
jgi:multidrug resistance efflux pump